MWAGGLALPLRFAQSTPEFRLVLPRVQAVAAVPDARALVAGLHREEAVLLQLLLADLVDLQDPFHACPGPNLCLGWSRCAVLLGLQLACLRGSPRGLTCISESLAILTTFTFN